MTRSAMAASSSVPRKRESRGRAARWTPAYAAAMHLAQVGGHRPEALT
jgi:hypothetical protein